MCGARSCPGGGVEMLPEEVVQAANPCWWRTQASAMPGPLNVRPNNALKQRCWNSMGGWGAMVHGHHSSERKLVSCEDGLGECYPPNLRSRPRSN